jgi:hypothetical protein
MILSFEEAKRKLEASQPEVGDKSALENYARGPCGKHDTVFYQKIYAILAVASPDSVRDRVIAIACYARLTELSKRPDSKFDIAHLPASLKLTGALK